MGNTPDMGAAIIGLFGVIYRNLVRDERDRVEISSDSRTAALSVLRRAGPCSMTELSRSLRVSKPNVTFLVDKLEEQGLVARQPDPADRRRTAIRLTDGGRVEIERKRRVVLRRVKAKLALLDPRDREYLAQALPRIVDILSRLYRPSESRSAGATRPMEEHEK